jgi:hypothetical protein
MAASFLKSRPPRGPWRLCLRSVRRQPSCTSASPGRRCAGGQTDSLLPASISQGHRRINLGAGYRPRRRYPRLEGPPRHSVWRALRRWEMVQRSPRAAALWPSGAAPPDRSQTTSSSSPALAPSDSRRHSSRGGNQSFTSPLTARPACDVPDALAVADDDVASGRRPQRCADRPVGARLSPRHQLEGLAGSNEGNARQRTPLPPFGGFIALRSGRVRKRRSGSETVSSSVRSNTAGASSRRPRRPSSSTQGECRATLRLAGQRRVADGKHQLEQLILIAASSNSSTATSRNVELSVFLP